MPFLGTRGAGTNKAFGFAGPSKPNQVTGLTATDFGTSRAYNNGRIDLSWSTPANNGATISGYKIERSTDNSTYSTLVASTGTTGTTYSDTSLTSSQVYYYKVSAINAVGTGDASTAANATATTVPQAPVVTAANVGTGRAYNNGAATITATGGATGGKAISSYTATSSPGSFTATSGSPLTVTGLQSATSYTFSVTATNANGTSTATTSGSITATTVPQAPTIGTPTAGTDATTQVNVAFTAGATGGSAIASYTATSSPGGITGTGASSPVTVSGLSPTTAYTFTVTATNANGTSTASSASSSITTATPTAFDSIATFTNTGSSTYTFSSIPQTYKSLQIRMCVTTVTNGSSLVIRPNGSDPTMTHALQANNDTFGFSAYSGSGDITGGVGSARPGAAIIDITDYASTTKQKTFRSFAGTNANAAVSDFVRVNSHLVTNTAAITSITINTAANTNNNLSIALYGVN